MDAITRADIARMDERYQRMIAAALQGIPSRWPELPPPYQVLEIIGGNTLSDGTVGITYNASAAATAIYNPEIDTSYASGLGNAWLYVNGTRQSLRVVVNHQFAGFPRPLRAGRRLRCNGTDSLTATPQASPPGSPAIGTKVVVAAGAGGAFAGQDGKLATWNGSSWDFTSAAGVSTSVTVYLPDWG